MKFLRRLLIAAAILVPAALVHADIESINQFSGINTDDSSVLLTNGQTPDSLNVVTDDGPGLKGRKGTIKFSTQICADMWEFPHSNGTRYLVCRSTINGTLTATSGGGTFNVYIASIPTDRVTVGTPLGDKFYFANTTDGLKYWNATSVTVASTSMTVDKLVTAQGRLWAAGKSSAGRTVFVSKYLDGTSWTTPANPTTDDATQFTVSGGLDDIIQALYATFRNTVVWFTRASFGAFYGTNRGNFAQRTYSDRIGLANPESIQDCNGYLRWLAPGREVYEYDGSSFQKLTDQVDNLMATMKQGDTASRSSTLTTEADWESGSHVPNGNLNTVVTPGSIVLTTSAVSAQSDTTQADFGAGILTSISSSTVYNGEIELSTSATQLNSYTQGDASRFPTGVSGDFIMSFTAAGNEVLTAIQLRGTRFGVPGTGPITIYNDNSNTVGTPILTFSYNLNNFSTSGSVVSIPLPSEVRLVSGNRYWIGVGQDTYTSGNNVNLGGCAISAPSCTNTGNKSYYNGIYKTTFDLYYKGDGYQFASAGNFVSRTFDLGITTNTWLFNWSTIVVETISYPTGGTLSYETQSSADGVSFDALVPVANLAVSTSIARRYGRYKATFATTDRSTSPVINSVTVNFSTLKKSSATYTSPVVPIGAAITAWRPVSIGGTTSSGAGSITFQVQSSTGSNISTNFTGAWTTITNNSAPTISTNPFVAFRATFTATNATDTLSLDDFTFAWTEGSNQRVASGFINQRYWLALATTSLLSNDVVFVFDRARQWQQYSHGADSITRYFSNPYFSNGNGIFQADQSFSDAGTPIIAYYRTRDIPPSGPDVQTMFDYLYVTAEKSDSTLTSSFRLNGIATDYNFGNYQMNQESGLQNFKLPFSSSEATQGKFISLRLQATGTSFWRILNGNIYHQKGVLPD